MSNTVAIGESQVIDVAPRMQATVAGNPASETVAVVRVGSKRRPGQAQAGRGYENAVLGASGVHREAASFLDHLKVQFRVLRELATVRSMMLSVIKPSELDPALNRLDQGCHLQSYLAWSCSANWPGFCSANWHQSTVDPLLMSS
jgi:hypothetical protein